MSWATSCDKVLFSIPKLVLLKEAQDPFIQIYSANSFSTTALLNLDLDKLLLGSFEIILVFLSNLLGILSINLNKLFEISWVSVFFC